MSYAEKIIEFFGGVRPMSQKTGIPIATIAYWKQQGRIPQWRQQEIIDHGKAHDIDLTPVDFVDQPEAEAS